MTCSIAQPFRVAPLPKISSLNDFSKQAAHLQLSQTSPIQQFSNSFNIGISGSSLSQYIINPTPKLIFNHPIPSTNVVSACDVMTIKPSKNKNSADVSVQNGETQNAADLSEAEEESEKELWVYGLLANGRITSFNYFTRNPNNENENISVTTVKQEQKIANLKILTAKNVLIVFENGTFCVYNFQDEKENSFTNLSYGSLYFSHFFQSENNRKNFLMTLTEVSSDKPGIVFKLHEIIIKKDVVSVVELQSTVLESFTKIETSNRLFYNSGKFYQLVNSKIEIYSLLPTFTKQHQSIDISSLISTDSDLEYCSLTPIAPNRCLLSCQNKIYLLDLLHKALLFTKELSTNVKSFQILQTGVLQSNQGSNTLALGVSTKHGATYSSFIDVVSIDVGSGTLKEALGKSFLKSSNTSEVLVFKTLLKPLESKGSQNPDANLDLTSIYQALVSQSSNADKFDETFFSKLNVDPAKGYYDESTDRFLNNAQFIEALCETTLTNFISKKQSPKAFTYLLTHPYFPHSKTSKLLSKLKFDPRLFKQCIVSCPALPIDELMEELFSVENDELLLELTLRILQDFNKEEIKSSIKVMSRLSVKNFITFVLNYKSIKNIQDNNIIETMPQIVQLLALVLDSIGIFQLDLPLLKRLSKFLVKNIQIVETNDLLLNLLDNNSNFAANGSLGFSANTTFNSKKQNSKKSSNDKYIPNYSIETLQY
ncbi:hypothetical protein ACO0QE_001553 [Hanseniaspora vineae]